MVRNTLLIAALAASSFAFAADYGPGSGGNIPDASADNTLGSQGTITSTINVASGATITSFNSVTVNGLFHTWAGDVVMTLTSPTGTVVTLVNRVGQTVSLSGFGDSSNYGSDGAAPLTGRTYTFVDSGGLDLLTAATAAGATVGIAAGTYNRQNHPIAGAPFNTTNSFATLTGQTLGGNWTLTASDWAGGDTGGFSNWTFNADAVPEPASMASLALGFGALAARRRRNRK
ncbi:MAG: proprotein convertase P-domain-containing protein [Fimbriimonadaceae bacterium]|nr:proprotein convertase P-domain-containing protein [Fimbriimonadaceae bacterium]